MGERTVFVISDVQNNGKVLRILGVTPFIWTMGESKGIPSLYNIHKYFADSGHEVHLLVSTQNPFIPHSQCELGSWEHGDISIHTFNPHLSLPNTLADAQGKMRKGSLFYNILGGIKLWCSLFNFFIFGSLETKRLMRDIKPDVIYGHTYFGQFVASFRAQGDIRNIYRVYGVGEYKNINKKGKFSLVIHPELVSFRLPVDLMVITDDGTYGDEVAHSIGVPKDKVKFWMNGVNKEFAQGDFDKDSIKEKFNIPKGKLILLCVSRLDYWKRLDRIIKAMPSISCKVQNVLCVIVGDGPYRSELEALSKRLGTEEVIRFMGSIPHDKVVDIMAIADVFVSLYDLSNVSNPLLEAMVTGRCIVTLDVGNTNRIVHDMKNGRLLNKKELPKLDEIMADLLGNQELRLRLAKGAREHGQRSFMTWDERAALELKAIEDILSHEGGP